MIQKILGLTVFLALLTAVGCSKTHSPIEGNWDIDLAQTLDNARSVGASARGVQDVQDRFKDGKLSVDSHTLKLSIAGVSGSHDLEYTVKSKEGECVVLEIKSTSSESKYCVSGTRLDVHDSTTPLVVVFRKS